MLYAHDDQLYLAFEPRSACSTSYAISSLENCLSRVNAWMTHHFLKLNDAKTELLVITSPSMTKHLQPIHLQQGDSTITPSQPIRNLGVTWDSTMRHEQHITHLCRSAYHQLHNIYRVKNTLQTMPPSLWYMRLSPHVQTSVIVSSSALQNISWIVFNACSIRLLGWSRLPTFIPHNPSASRTSLAPGVSQDTLQDCPTYIQSILWPGSRVCD